MISGNGFIFSISYLNLLTHSRKFKWKFYENKINIMNLLKNWNLTGSVIDRSKIYIVSQDAEHKHFEHSIPIVYHQKINSYTQKEYF